MQTFRFVLAPSNVSLFISGNSDQFKVLFREDSHPLAGIMAGCFTPVKPLPYGECQLGDRPGPPEASTTQWAERFDLSVARPGWPRVWCAVTDSTAYNGRMEVHGSGRAAPTGSVFADGRTRGRTNAVVVEVQIVVMTTRRLLRPSRWLSAQCVVQRLVIPTSWLDPGWLHAPASPRS